MLKKIFFFYGRSYYQEEVFEEHRFYQVSSHIL